jgi:CDGSH-type Zn-finger protein
MAEVTIVVRPNGPYRVTGPIKLVDDEGNEFEMKGEIAVLCRCGASANKPFCDSTHRRINFTPETRAPKRQ